MLGYCISGAGSELGCFERIYDKCEGVVCRYDQKTYMGDLEIGMGRLHTCVCPAIRFDTTTRRRESKVASIPNQLAKEEWFMALHNGYIFLALNTKGAGIDNGYF